MKTKETQITKRKAEMEHSKNAVMNTTGVTLLEYNTFLYDIGVELVETHTIKYKELIRMAEYWKWFRNEFHMYEKNLFNAMRIVREELDNPKVDCPKFSNYIYTKEMNIIIEDEFIVKSLFNFLKQH